MQAWISREHSARVRCGEGTNGSPLGDLQSKHSYGTPVLKRLGFEALAGLQKIGRGGLMELLLANKSIQSMVQNILHA